VPALIDLNNLIDFNETSYEHYATWRNQNTVVSNVVVSNSYMAYVRACDSTEKLAPFVLGT
jgi:hypothetical protein